MAKKPKTFYMLGWHCGTASCAVGHACFIPEFQKEGLSLIHNCPVYKDESDIYETEYNNWCAVYMFFDLNAIEAEHLFSADSYYCTEEGKAREDKTTPQKVSQRIREFIKEGGMKNDN